MGARRARRRRVSVNVGSQGSIPRARQGLPPRQRLVVSGRRGLQEAQEGLGARGIALAARDAARAAGQSVPMRSSVGPVSPLVFFHYIRAFYTRIAWSRVFRRSFWMLVVALERLKYRDTYEIPAYARALRCVAVYKLWRCGNLAKMKEISDRPARYGLRPGLKPYGYASGGPSGGATPPATHEPRACRRPGRDQRRRAARTGKAARVRHTFLRGTHGIADYRGPKH